MGSSRVARVHRGVKHRPDYIDKPGVDYHLYGSRPRLSLRSLLFQSSSLEQGSFSTFQSAVSAGGLHLLVYFGVRDLICLRLQGMVTVALLTLQGLDDPSANEFLVHPDL